MRIPRFASALLMTSALALGACQTTSGTATFNTNELNLDAQAAAFAAKTIEADPTINAKLTVTQKAQITAALNAITATTAQIAAASGGSVSVDISKQWASSLLTELQTFLSIASPLVTEFDPSLSSYVSTAQDLIPLIQAIVAVVGHNVSASPTSVNAPVVRSKLYTPPVSAVVG